MINFRRSNVHILVMAGALIAAQTSYGLSVNKSFAQYADLYQYQVRTLVTDIVYDAFDFKNQSYWDQSSLNNLIEDIIYNNFRTSPRWDGLFNKWSVVTITLNEIVNVIAKNAIQRAKFSINSFTINKVAVYDVDREKFIEIIGNLIRSRVNNILDIRYGTIRSNVHLNGQLKTYIGSSLNAKVYDALQMILNLQCSICLGYNAELVEECGHAMHEYCYNNNRPSYCKTCNGSTTNMHKLNPYYYGFAQMQPIVSTPALVAPKADDFEKIDNMKPIVSMQPIISSPYVDVKK